MPEQDAVAAGLPERLREARRRAGLSQTQLAGEALSPSYISLLESGRRNPTQEVLTLLANRLGCGVDYLARGHDPGAGDRVRLTLDYAELALRNGEPADALTQLTALAAGASGPAWLSPEDAWRMRRLRARALEGLGRLEDAVGEIESLREQAQRDRRHDEHLRLTVDAIRCYHELGDLAYALDVGEATLARVREWGLTGSDTHAELASTVLGLYYERGDLARAESMATEVLAAIGPGGSTRARAAVYWNASLVAEQRGDLPAAMQLAERALAVYAEGDDQRALGRLRVAYGWLLLRCLPPRAEEAIRELSAGRDALTEAGTEVDLAYCETELGRCQLLLGRPQDALALAESALHRLGSSPRLEHAHSTLVRARALLALGRRDEAVEAYRAAAQGLGGQLLARQAAAAWRELADAFTGLGMLEDAALAYQQALTDAGVRAAPDAVSVVPAVRPAGAG